MHIRDQNSKMKTHQTSAAIIPKAMIPTAFVLYKSSQHTAFKNLHGTQVKVLAVRLP